jgi:hypothetical protein
MNHLQLRAIILANPTEPPTRIAERIDVPAWRVKDVRKGLIHIGAVVRLAKTNGPITDVDTAAIIAMRRAGHSISAIKDHFRRSYSVVFRIIAAATKAGQIDPAKRIVPAKPVKPAKARLATTDAETQPVKRRQRQERETCRGGLGDMPAPAPRKPKEPPCRWALSLMARGMSEAKAREQARLDRHKRKLEPWGGAGPFHS